MTHDEMIKVIQAAERGEPIESVEIGSDEWHVSCPSWNFATFKYRIAPKPPVKRRVPLGPEDVPPGSVLYHPKWDDVCWLSITAVSDNAVGYASLLSKDGWTKTWNELMNEGFEISRDGGQTFRPCWKEVEE